MNTHRLILGFLFAASALCAGLLPAAAAEQAGAPGPRQEADRLAHFAIFDRAADAYRKLHQAAPGDVGLRLALVEVCYRDRRFEDAEKECRALLEGGGAPAQKALAHACLGDVYRRMGRAEDARKAYDAAKAAAEESARANAQVPAESSEASARVKRGLGFLGWEKVEGQRTVLYFPPDSPAKSGGAVARPAEQEPQSARRSTTR